MRLNVKYWVLKTLTCAHGVSIRFTNNDFQHIIGNFALDSCSFCSKFNFPQSLTMQDKQVESCPSCAKTFSSRIKLKKHQRQVHHVNPVPCNECGELQYNAYSLKSHLLTHQEVNCNICNLKCTRSTIARHMKTHLEVKDSFMCEECTLGQILTAGRHYL